MCRIRRIRFLQKRVAQRGLLLLAGGGMCLLAGCRQDMADQPRQNPLSASVFFEDAMSARPLVEETVPYGSAEEDFLNVSENEEAVPIPVTEELLNRGRERFNIFCSVCHGRLGDGNGMIPRRGFRHPPSYHIDRLRSAPVGHFYDVVVNGFGAMPSYAAQVPPRDRWAIIAYIRALQLSQHALEQELSPEERARLETATAPGGPR